MGPPVVKVRPAVEGDIPTMVRLGRRLHAESPRYRDRHFDPDKVTGIARAVIAQGGAHVAEDDGKIVGLIAGFVVEHWFGRDKMASDFTFYVAPEARGGRAALMLVRAFEAWAISQGVKDIVPGVSTELNVEGVAAFYNRLGYRTYGATFLKEVA